VLSQGASAGSTLRLGDAVPLVLSAGPDPALPMSGQHRVGVGGTCELQVTPNIGVCIGGPLLVPFEDG
jgi:hypothetical protein